MSIGKGTEPKLCHSDVAIIGMACVFPKAPDLQTFWENILSKVDAITDPPEESLTSRVFDPDSTASNRIYCKRGGYLEDLPAFHPDEFGVMPVSVAGAEPEHFMALQTAHEALRDAGFPEKPFDRERTEVILGRGTFVNRGYVSLMQRGLVIDQTIELLRQLHPEYAEEELETIEKDLLDQLPPFTPETAPGLCHNVMAGIIANRLDLKGPSIVVDSACASGLVALEIAMQDLQARKCDAALIGGVQISTHAPIHMVFSQLGALSRSSKIRPFDTCADGTVLGEGIGMMVLKRKEDAIRDNHRIYAVVRGVGTSSDGKGRGLLAPRAEGEELALRRAYEAAGVDPRTVEMIEAHGTAIPLGDTTEVEALRRVFGSGDGYRSPCAIGSVKSMIGHLIPAAGIAGLIKASLAIYHKILPPTIHCETPNPDFQLEKTHFYVNTETRPWIHGAPENPRRAGISAFGFGGINAHAVLEENVGGNQPSGESIDWMAWETELCVLQANTRDELIALCHQGCVTLSKQKHQRLVQAIYHLSSRQYDYPYRLAVVASSVEDLSKKLAHAAGKLRDQNCSQIKDRSGIYFFEEPIGGEGKVAFLFPGEGSQYVDMLADICLHFPEARRCFDLLDQAFSDHPRGYLPSHFIFPPSKKEKEYAEERISQMDGAVDAVTTADRALFQVIRTLSIQPDAMLGHSSGELAALEASGAVVIDTEAELIHHIQAGNQMIERLRSDNHIPQAQLLAVGGVNYQTVSTIVSHSDDLRIAMDNCPHQYVLCGSEQSIAKAHKSLQGDGAICQLLPFGRAYHTERFAKALGPLADFFAKATIKTPNVTVYTCLNAAPYPADPEEIGRLALRQWASPVRFRETILAMYRDGYRTFLEVGPRANLTGFVNDTLKGKQFLAVASNSHQRSGITQLNHALGLLAAHGIPVQLDALYRNRIPAETEQIDRESQDAGMPIRTDLPRLHLGENALHGPLGRSDVSQRHRRVKARGIEKGSSSIPADAAVPGLPAEKHSLVSSKIKDTVWEEYMNTMEGFLAVQREVMEAYLQQRHGLERDDLQSDVSLSPKPPQAAPARSLSRCNTEGLEAAHPSPPKTPNRETGCRRGSEWDEINLSQLLFQCVSEKTGYPVEMFTLDQQLEADLGIDSIKKVEILGDLSRKIEYLGEVDRDFLLKLKTLGEIVQFLLRARGGRDPSGNQSAPGLDKKTATEKKGYRQGTEAETSDLPFVGECVPATGEERITVLRELDIHKDLFLLDHTLGGRVSQQDEELLALPVLPFSMGVEMMAEAAAQVFPDKPLVEIRDVKSHDWVSMEMERLPVEITAMRLQAESGARVFLKIPKIQKDTDQNHVAMEGTFVFGHTYPQPPRVKPFRLDGQTTFSITSDRFYPEVLFHGPSFQTVSKVQRSGKNGLEAIVRNLPADGLFTDIPAPHFLADPVLLDAAGQVVGLWAAHTLDENYVIFPDSLDRVVFYGKPERKPDRISCRARTELNQNTHIRSHIDLVDPEGSLRVSLTGLQHRRVNLPEILHRFRGSRSVMLSTPWDTPLHEIPASGRMICCRLQCLPIDFNRGDGLIWRNILAHIVLGRRERKTWTELSGAETRRTEWLLARVVGKEAIRLLLQKHCGLDVWPADIDIKPDGYGRPIPEGPWETRIPFTPNVSLTHSRGTPLALAAVAENTLGLGIDMERIRPIEENFCEFALWPEERQLLDSLGLHDSSEWIMRIWCAKEAVGKAIGKGLTGGPRELILQSLDSESGTMGLKFARILSTEMAYLNGKTLYAYTTRDEDVVIASAVYEKGGAR
jgi:acyl transferase domain-containing protein/phosphopantetheinyl transferase/acyl carrier protein